ncbi:hypothetical protein [Streptomyces sp. NPDC004579]|uniref:hypothetical protein n=1 Tax=Streptomyces sp. NPDC004579 TaxID=3154667 RepID=UPI0033B9E4EA
MLGEFGEQPGDFEDRVPGAAKELSSSGIKGPPSVRVLEDLVRWGHAKPGWASGSFRWTSDRTALTVRMLAMRVARSDQSAVDLFDKRVTDFEHLKEEFRVNGLIVDDAGSFVTK